MREGWQGQCVRGGTGGKEEGGRSRRRGREGVARGGWLFKNENPLSRGWWEKILLTTIDYDYYYLVLLFPF